MLWLRESRPQVATVCAVAAAATLLIPGWDRLLTTPACFVSPPEAYHFQGLFTMPGYRNSVSLHYLRDDPMMTWRRTARCATAPAAARRSNRRRSPSTANPTATRSAITEHGARGHDSLSACPAGNGVPGGGHRAGHRDDLRRWRLPTTSTASRRWRFPMPSSRPCLTSMKATSSCPGVPNRTSSRPTLSGTSREPASVFDVIASEPSNPWVVGVENLFTPEFYQLISQSLNDGGVLPVDPDVREQR